MIKRKNKIFFFIVLFISLIITNTKSFATTVSELKNKYPTGMQWNDSYHGYIECIGFASLMYDEYYGINPLTHAQQTKEASQIKAGDIVRYSNHSVWVTARNGDVLTVAECNYDWHNHVRWDQTRYISSISGSIEYIMQAPWELGTTPPALGSPASVSVDTSDGVVVSWSKVAYSTGYQIKIYNSKNELVNDYEVTNRGVASRRISGLAKDTYTLKIYAKRNNTLSSNCAITTFSCEQEAKTYSVKPEHLMVEVGKTAQFTYNLYPEGAAADCYFFNAPNRTNTNIARIDSEGNVTGISEGSTYVSFHFGKNSDEIEERGTYKVTVVKGIKFKQTNKTLKPGEKFKIEVASMPNEYTNLKWSSSYPKVAEVDQEGNVTALSEGTIVISLRARVYDPEDQNMYTTVYDTFELAVREPEPEVTFKEKFINLPKSMYSFYDEEKYKAELTNGQTAEVELSSNNDCVTIGGSQIFGKSGGFATVSGHNDAYGELKYICFVNDSLRLSNGAYKFAGDLNGNNKFDAEDVTLLRSAINAGNLSDDNKKICDINGDGKYNTEDVELLNKIVTEKLLTINDIVIDSVTITDEVADYGDKKIYSLMGMVYPLNTTLNKTLTYSSGNTSIATITQSGTITVLKPGKVTFTATSVNGKTATQTYTFTEDDVTNKQTVKTPSVKYRTHVQKEGWQEYVKDGAKSGTTGKALRLEGIKIEIEGNGITGGIKYSTHVQKEGWQNYVENGILSGTTGKGLRLEAIKIELTGEIAKQYDIYYRVHAQKFGWMGWARNGEEAGTQGYGYRLEAIEVKLVKKGETTPTSTVAKFSKCPTITYQSYVQKEGWQSKVSNGAISGTTGKGLRLEGIKINLNTYGVTGGIKYSAHVQKEGWQNYVENGALSGTTEKELRLEAIKIELTGDMTKQFDVYYRVHAEKFGWMGWAKNGEKAGTQGYGYRIEAIEIKIVVKGTTAPGKTDNIFAKK